MLRATIVVLSTIILCPFISASPTASNLLPRTCSPNFEGHNQSIFVRPELIDRAVFEWRPDSIFPGTPVRLELHNINDAYAQGEFVVEHTGQPNGSYRFKFTADTNRYIALTAGASGGLTFDVITGASSLSQEFTIACSSCSASGAGAETCTIVHPASGNCVTGSTNEPIHLGSCASAGVYSFSDGTLV